MQESWKKLENENGYTFYLNENIQKRQWDHPKFVKLKQLTDECNYVKYSKYRVAIKFRVLQKALFMDEISLKTVLGVFAKHRLGANESSLCLESYDLEAILFDIYFAANKQHNKTVDVDFAVELMQNLMYNIYDKERQAKMQVSSAKLVLALLCDCDLWELYNLIFALCADHNNCVTRLRLQSLLAKFVKIFDFMHEDVSFGQHLINTTTESCFYNSPGLVGLCGSSFISWLEEGPQLFCWIPILHRMKSCELMVHNATCSTCNLNPMMGFMYKCMKCSKYTQCQRCFFTGRINNSHKLSHSMKEYCAQERRTREFMFTFIKKLCGLMPCSLKLDDADSGVIQMKTGSCDKDFLLKSASTSDLYNTLEPLSSPYTQLQLIITQLELQNRRLHRILLLGVQNEQEIRKYLEEHKVEVAAQIHNLKLLKKYLYGEKQTSQKTVMESTPMVGTEKYSKRSRLGNMPSPIIQISESNETPCNYQTLFFPVDSNDAAQETITYSVNDISTWLKDQSVSSKSDVEILARRSPVRELHNDLDDALAKLQQILANNFTLDAESLGNIDNSHLKHAVSEVEGMLTSFIDNVESSASTSVPSFQQS